MKLVSFILFVCCSSFALCQSDNQIKGPFFGISPTSEPQLLAPDLIASPAQEYNGTFSVDGTEFYYTTDIPENAFITVTKMKDDQSWSEPEIADFSGVFSDFDPLFSPDGSRIYFSSSRPHPDNAYSGIWFVEKSNGRWTDAERVALGDPDLHRYYSSVTNDGTIYFSIWSTRRIMKGAPSSEGYVVQELDSMVNDGNRLTDPFISPDESYLIFRGYRDDSFGRADLYISYKTPRTWTEPINLGRPINSEAQEVCPYVTPDGRILIFSSDRISSKVKVTAGSAIQQVRDKFNSLDNGEQNIYYVSTEFIEKLRPKN